MGWSLCHNYLLHTDMEWNSQLMYPTGAQHGILTQLRSTVTQECVFTGSCPLNSVPWLYLEAIIQSRSYRIADRTT